MTIHDFLIETVYKGVMTFLMDELQFLMYVLCRKSRTTLQI